MEKGGGGLGGGTDLDIVTSPILDRREEGKEKLEEELFPFNFLSSGLTKLSGSTLTLKKGEEILVRVRWVFNPPRWRRGAG